MPGDGIPSEQAHAELIHERRRLQADAGPFTGEVAGRDAVQFVVDQRQHALEGIGLALAPALQQFGYLALLPIAPVSPHDPDRV